MTELTREAVLHRLRGLISYEVKIKHLAEQFGVSPPFMSAVLAGKKSPTSVMLAAINIRKVTTYTEGESQ